MVWLCLLPVKHRPFYSLGTRLHLRGSQQRFVCQPVYVEQSEIKVEGKTVGLKQTTNYPWTGDIQIEVTPKKKQDFNLKIRVPGWVQGQVVPSDLYSYTDKKKLSYTLKVNGQTVESQLINGYFTIARTWVKGDKVEIHFDMEPRTVKAHPLVEADRGKVAIERGPVVYCAEWPDNDFSVRSAILPQKPVFTVENKPELLYGLTMIHTDAQILSYNNAGKIEVKDVKLNMIPYYAWAHRGSGEMTVWLSNDLSSSRPVLPPTIASESKIEASHPAKSIGAVNDRLIPKDEKDSSVPYYHWWPKAGTTEWVSYNFESEKTISSSKVYWYDDGPWGGCRVPASWKIYYKDTTGNWVQVENTTPYAVIKGVANEVSFTPVKTSAVKLEVKLPADNAAGVFEWEVE